MTSPLVDAKGTVLVLSVLGSSIEDRIAALDGPRIHVALPAPAAAARAATGPSYAVYPIADWSNLDDMLHLARTVHATTPLASIVAAIEPAVVPAGFLRSTLRLPGLDYETAHRATDKHRMKAVLGEAGLPVAAHRLAHSADDIEECATAVGGYPVVIKPRSGFGVINTHLVRGSADLADLHSRGVFDHGVDHRIAASLAVTGVGAGLAGVGGFLVEKCLEVTAEYHCEVLRVAGSIAYALPYQYLAPLMSPASIIGSIAIDGEAVTGALIRRMSIAAVTALGIDNAFSHVEILRDRDGRFYVGEVAARRGGGAIAQAMALVYGIDSLDLEARWARGHTPAPTVEPQPGVHGWAGVRIRHHGRITDVADRDEILAAPDVTDATILAQPGQLVAPGGSGLFAGHIFYRGNSHDEVIAAMRTTAQRLRLRYHPLRPPHAPRTAANAIPSPRKEMP